MAGETLAERRNQRDGTLSVWQGVVSVQGPAGAGAPAQICPGDGIEIRVNGEPVAQRQAVLPSDTIELQVTAQLPDRDRYKLDRPPDRMRVALRVMPLGRYTVADTTAVPEWVPQLTLGLGTTVTVDEILGALDAQGVSYGIDREAIAEATRAADGRSRVIAQGRAPIPGVDGHLRWQVAAIPAAHAMDEQVDLRDRGTPLTVEAGIRLAVVAPPTPGRPGVNILGEEVPVEPPLVCKAVAGAGAELLGDTLVSTRAGRPVESALGAVVTVKVLPLYQHIGDVDVSTGHLRVKGDLLITGSVTPGMEVHAEGSVLIRGQVQQADVRAGGNITVQGNAIGSTLVAGGRQALYRTILPGLIALDSRLGDLTLVIGQILQNHPQQREQLQRTGVGPLLQRLMETAFADVPTSAQTLADLVAAADDREDELAQLLGIVLHSKLLGKQLLALRDLTELARARHLLARIEKTMQAETGDSCAIVVPYCEQSTLRSSGNIRVGGMGSYRSQLIAYQHTAVRGPVVGGSLTCQGSIEASQLGNEAGVPTDATVGALGRIRAGEAHPGVTVRVGSFASKVRDRGPLDVRADNIRQPR